MRLVLQTFLQNVQRKPRLSQDVFNLPEFQILLDKLGIPKEQLSGITIKLRTNELVLVAVELDGENKLLEPS